MYQFYSLWCKKNIDIGIPQGSILGPLLFIPYVNSLPDCIVCKCVMYDNGTTLLFTASDPTSLQATMNDYLRLLTGFKPTNVLLTQRKPNSWFLGLVMFLISSVI